MNPCLDQNDEERVEETEEKPDLNVLDRRGGGETCRHRNVEGAQNHHAGDVDSDNVGEQIVALE